MKIAVITGLAGMGTATIRDPSNGGFAGIDYYAFSDRQLDTKVWQPRSLYNFSTDTKWASRRNAKLAKVLGWLLVPGYDYYIWHDNYCDLQMDPGQLVEQYLNNYDIALFKHPARDCSYLEAYEIAKEADIHENALGAVNFLIANQWPEHSGLFELSSFVYANNTRVQQAFLCWWELLCKYTSRDQVLFPYVVKQHQIRYNYLPGSAQAYGGNNNIIPMIRSKFS